MSSSKASKTLVLGTSTSTASTTVTTFSKGEIYYNIPQVVALLHVSERTLLRWRLNHTLPAAKIGRTILYPASLLHGIIEQRARQHHQYDS